MCCVCVRAQPPRGLGAMEGAGDGALVQEALRCV